MIKRKVLVWADSPTVSTGFAQVSRNILKELYKTGRYEIDVVGINFSGAYSREKFDKEYAYINRIIPAHTQSSPDMYGRELLLEVLSGRNQTLGPPYDIFFSIQDHFIVYQKDYSGSKGLGQAIKTMQKNTLMAEEFRANHFLWIGYFPVDGQLKPGWVTDAIASADYPVAYCEFGRDEMLKHDPGSLKDRLKVIYHGTNVKDFYPVDQQTRREWREKIFRESANDFIIINVARNQPRKDLFRTLMVFREWLKVVPDSILYLHCDPTDPYGGNLFDIGDSIGLPMDRVRFPKNFRAESGFSIDRLNMLYNSADVFLTTTLGEGWGLPITEAMATRLPVYAPNHTSIQNILHAESEWNPQTARGMAFQAGSSPTEWINFGATDNEVSRPISNVASAVEMLRWGRNNPQKVSEIVDRAYQWTQQHTWEIENEKWVEIFDSACEVNDQLRLGKGVKVAKIGRNDPCPVCRDKKIKNCLIHRNIYLR